MRAKQKWYMMTLVGKDRPGVVAHVTAALFEGGANLGESLMTCLSGNLSIMMMVQFSGNTHALHELVGGVAESLDLHLHIDPIEAQLRAHRTPDVRISVAGSDRTGIVAKVTGVLAETGLDISRLEFSMAGTEAEPVYIMTIEGYAVQGIPTLESALDIIKAEGIDARLQTLK
jgi:glycine cleavage system transcriptional repressor